MTESVIVRMPTSLAGGRARLLLCGDAEAGTLRVLSGFAANAPMAHQPPPARTATPEGTAIEHYSRGAPDGNAQSTKTTKQKSGDSEV